MQSRPGCKDDLLFRVMLLILKTTSDLGRFNPDAVLSGSDSLVSHLLCTADR